MLKDGRWDADWHPVQDKDEDGRFVRQTSSFRNWVTADGEPGPEGQKAETAETGRYHLYVAAICPWASRALILRKLKGLEEAISVSVVKPVLTEQGWQFGDYPGSTGADTHLGAEYMHQIYTHADPKFTGRATVPVLWDKKNRTIVNNESADILRILNQEFDAYGDPSINVRPEAHLDDINTLNEVLYETLNNGVYKAGFASSQVAHEEAVTGLFATLDSLEDQLSDGRDYLFGEVLTETDIRLFVTLIRFDAAYVNIFKCNLRRIADYPYLSAYLKRLFAIPAFSETTRIDHIKAGYFSIKALNPTGIVPVGPDLSELVGV
ncbi:MAG: glutathione S-transferase family protein [Stappiaceae bacterium]